MTPHTFITQRCLYFQYVQGLGYCPQTLSLDTFRTGIANMRMLMCLRGVEESDVKSETEAWIKLLGKKVNFHPKFLSMYIFRSVVQIIIDMHF